MRELLLLPQSKINITKVVDFVGNDKERYAELVKNIITNDPVFSNKASWALSHCYDNKVGYFIEFLDELLPVLEKDTYSDSTKRNIIRILQFVNVPEKHRASVIDSCFLLLNNKEKASAILAFSMQVLYNMSLIYPELKNELIFSIEEIIPNATPGVKNRGKNILKKLR